MTSLFASFRLTGFLLLLAALVPCLAASSAAADPGTLDWTTGSARHAYGFPDVSPNKKGTLTLDSDMLAFSSSSASGAILRSSIRAVSSANERVELWGTGGRIFRMVIPEGGGLVAATFMHHRVGMLTVEFRDPRGATHYAVFYLPAAEVEGALAAFAAKPFLAAPAVASGCDHDPIEPGSVLVDPPSWQSVEVPAAYKALIYEHTVDRLRHAKGVSRVYRSGETMTACPQYRIDIYVRSFKPGNQVVRAATGPVGMFTSPTQIAFEAHFTDAAGHLDIEEQLHAAVHTDAESVAVADRLAKTLTKHYREAIKHAPAAAREEASR